MKRRSIWVVEYRSRKSSEVWKAETLIHHSKMSADDYVRKANHEWVTLIHRVVRYDASR